MEVLRQVSLNTTPEAAEAAERNGVLPILFRAAAVFFRRRGTRTAATAATGAAVAGLRAGPRPVGRAC